MITTLATLVLLVSQPAEARGALSRRVQLRYEDVVTTKDGTRWRGKLLEKGAVYRIRLDNNSEVVIPKEEVEAVTRELHPGYPHSGQWCFRASTGLEVGVLLADTNAGLRYGPTLELTIARGFGGSVEPELIAILSSMGAEQGQYTFQLGAGSRVYFQPERRAKPFASTQFILYGSQGDIGIRTGPGFQWDISPYAGISFVQGFELVSQLKGQQGEDGSVAAVGLGYHLMIELQGRF